MRRGGIKKPYPQGIATIIAVAVVLLMLVALLSFSDFRREVGEIWGDVEDHVPSSVKNAVEEIWTNLPQEGRELIQDTLGGHKLVLPALYKTSGGEYRTTLVVISLESGMRLYEPTDREVYLILTNELLNSFFPKGAKVSEIENIQVEETGSNRYDLSIEIEVALQTLEYHMTVDTENMEITNLEQTT